MTNMREEANLQVNNHHAHVEAARVAELEAAQAAAQDALMAEMELLRRQKHGAEQHARDLEDQVWHLSLSSTFTKRRVSDPRQKHQAHAHWFCIGTLHRKPCQLYMLEHVSAQQCFATSNAGHLHALIWRSPARWCCIEQVGQFNLYRVAIVTVALLHVHCMDPESCQQLAPLYCWLEGADAQLDASPVRLCRHRGACVEW